MAILCHSEELSDGLVGYHQIRFSFDAITSDAPSGFDLPELRCHKHNYDSLEKKVTHLCSALLARANVARSLLHRKTLLGRIEYFDS